MILEVNSIIVGITAIHHLAAFQMWVLSDGFIQVTFCEPNALHVRVGCDNYINPVLIRPPFIPIL